MRGDVQTLESRVLLSASVIQAISPANSLGAAASSSVNVGGIIYFAGKDSAHGDEVWRTDGTAAGTSLVADLNPGPGSSDPDLFTFNDTLFFAAYDGTRRNLYRSDGTSAGTTVIFQEPKAGLRAEPWHFTAVGNQLYFLGSDAGPSTWFRPLDRAGAVASCSASRSPLPLRRGLTASPPSSR